jgi:spermidine synthase
MSRLRKTVFGLFFLSGFCGLLYQVVWLRLAFAHFGIITPVLSVVVSVFMLGLSLGSWAGGTWIAKSAAWRKFPAMYAYAATEALIGVGAFMVPMLYRIGDTALLPGGETNSVSYLGLSALAIALSILPWCFLMGATFPLMMAFLKEQDTSSETSFSFLYLANVIGAMFGTICTADLFVETMGFHRTLQWAGAINFLIAGISFFVGTRYPLKPGSGLNRKSFLAEGDRPAPVSLVQSGAAMIFGILFLTGFTSMSLEVIWIRNFTTVLGTTVYAFAFIVAVYLLATWGGSALYRKHVQTDRTLSMEPLLAALAVMTLFMIVINDPRLIMRKVGVVLAIVPYCFLLGYLTPSLVDRFAHGDPDRAGKAYAINIIGCILGPLFASYVFLPWLGARGSMIAMALPFVVIAGVKRMSLRPPWRIATAASVSLFLVSSLFFNRTYEERGGKGVVRRDATATVISLGTGMEKKLLVNGVGITNQTTVTKVMAHWPLALIPHPTAALDICFGMGTTYRSLMRWEGVQVTAVELVPSVKEAFGYYHDDAAAVMSNPRGHVVIDDGRRFLRRNDQKYDVITIDPPPPIEAAGSSLLYSREFNQLLKERLKPHGILQQWFPGGPGPEFEAIARSLTEVFPYVRAYRSLDVWGVHFLCSSQPISMPGPDELIKRLPRPVREDLMEWETQRDLPTVARDILKNELPLTALLNHYHEAEAVTDDRPFNEYYLIRRGVTHFRRTGHF